MKSSEVRRFMLVAGGGYRWLGTKTKTNRKNKDRRVLVSAGRDWNDIILNNLKNNNKNECNL